MRMPLIVSKLFWYRPRIEAAVSALDVHRLKLPLLSLNGLFPEFTERSVSFHEVPVGPWSSPLVDVAMLLKIAVCARPKRVMEAGSYRGYTALLLARHLEDDTRVVAVDANPNHGEAYRASPLAEKIERRVCWISTAAFEADEPRSYGLIFLDAGHRYEEVKHDTELLLPLLADDGYFVWHDYGNWGRFSQKNGVPEYLHELSENLPLANVAGTWLAVYSPAWQTDVGRDKFQSALVDPEDSASANPWDTELSRG